MIKAVAYARYSSDNQRAESIDAQLYDIRKWAADNQVQIVAVYTDEAESATSDDRDQFLQMIADLQHMDNIAYVLVHKTDRFARNKYDSAIYKKLLNGLGIKVIYVTQPMLNDSTPEGFLLEGIFESLDQYYSLNLSREVMKGHRNNARDCKHNGGIPPLGFNVDPTTKTYVINEREAKAVLKIFTMYDQGYSYDKIIDELNVAGHKTKTGKTFAKNSISDILRNEKYIGTYVYNRRQHTIKGKRNNRKDKPADQIIKIPGGMPQIVPDDLWERVQARIASRAKNMGERAQNKAKTDYLLSGKIECGLCGYKMVGKGGGSKKNKKRKDFYICNNRERRHECKAKMIGKDLIEQLVLEEIECRILNPNIFPELATEIYRNMIQAGGESEKEVIYLKAELVKNQIKINNILSMIEEGTGSKVLLDRLNQRESEQVILENRLREVERKTKASSLTEKMILQFLNEEYKNIKLDDSTTAKALINRYVEKVIIYEKEFEVKLNVLHTDGGGGACHIVCSLSYTYKTTWNTQRR
jgi:site-specific DNA recombinase